MSFVVKGSFGEIEVDCIINGLITPNKMIMFNAMLVDGRKIFVGIAPINKGYQEALEQIQEINKILEGANCKKKKQHQPINLSTNGRLERSLHLFYGPIFS